ncbi:MBL fold metallo-hydrolase [Lederbergia citrea]|uniref:MBL fold metallo-hydrolase n=1 Tax=Lederbergia citrea TaxID=2833581 RepID=UPI001BC9AB88|nr:MBL fold metallo-hydrolase [Lederbergia citrea]MBS4205208.1 MBL fold metallo-hydrolase [Lederbergia citrea]
MKQISQNLFLYEDTCNVYVIRSGDQGILIDFGAGDVMAHLSSIGVNQVTDILMTHHHRDQAQGLDAAVKKDIRIWVPHTEQNLFHSVNEHWKAREIDNNYNMRQDRFSLLQSVSLYGTLKDYSTHHLNGIKFTILPTPGHTIGSITILAEIDGMNVAFTGDLIYAPGKVWSMSATQWSYNGGEGIALSVLSLLDLKDRDIDILLPSHGQAMIRPIEAIDLLIDRFTELMKERKQNPRLFHLKEKPYKQITPHLLQNQTSMANSYVLLSNTGKALLIDFGYDFIGGMAAGADRASRRPWLYTLNKLKEDFNVENIDVVIPTHYHDDHVAGMNILRDVEGTQVWCPINFSNILEEPKKYNLPCLWYDPIKVDKTLPLNKKIRWEEYEFTLYEQPGHTLYAVAIAFEVDGKRVLAIGDQYQGDGDEYNYVYGNEFRINDYIDSADLYKSLKPDLLISGHWDPVQVTEGYLQKIAEKGKNLEELHRDLLPLETIDFGANGFGATIEPYQSIVEAGESFSITVEIKNPFQDEHMVTGTIITPNDWQIENNKYGEKVAGNMTANFTATITVPKGVIAFRERITVDITVGNQHFGQHAEALVSIIN